MREFVDIVDDADDDNRSSSFSSAEHEFDVLSVSDTSGDGYNTFFLFGKRLLSLGASQNRDISSIKPYTLFKSICIRTNQLT